MRIVADTNVLLSGLFWRGAPHTLLEHVRNGAVTLITSPAMLAELAEVLDRGKFATILTLAHTTREDVVQELRRIAELVQPWPLPVPVCRDPDDDHVIACALAARADAIVSGDHDLLDLGEYQGIPILSATQALARMA